MGAGFSEVKSGVAKGHIDFDLDEFGATGDDGGKDQWSNISWIDFAWEMSGEGIMVAGSQSLTVIIIDFHASMLGSNPIIVVFNEVEKLIFAWGNDRHV